MRLLLRHTGPPFIHGWDVTERTEGGTDGREVAVEAAACDSMLVS